MMYKLKCIALLLALLQMCSTQQHNPGEEDSLTSSNVPAGSRSSTFEELLLPKGYSKLSIPLEDDGGPVEVEVSIFIRSILNLNEKEEEILLDADLRISWTDWNIIKHLNNVSWKDPQTGESIGNFTLDSEFLASVWKPDVFIDEMASSEKISLLSSPVTLLFSRDLGSNEQILVYSARTKLKLRCEMSFQYYPADTQTCRYVLRSYSHKMEHLILLWDPEGKGVFLNDPSNPNFDLQVESFEPFKNLEKLFIQESFDSFRHGQYSALTFTIKARRRLSYHLVQTYLMSSLLIAITGLTFLLPSNMVETRIGISMTIVLTLTAMFAGVRQISPLVSYTMAIDVWMVINILIVFVVLFLFTTIYWMKLNLERKQKGCAKNGENIEIPGIKLEKKAYHKIVNYTKHYAFWVFAAVFLIFLGGYWAWLLTSSEYLNWFPSPEFNGARDHGGKGFQNFYKLKSISKLGTEEDLSKS